MFKIVSAAALLCVVAWSVPAFATTVAECNQNCAKNCPGKGNVCIAKCTESIACAQAARAKMRD